MKFPVWSRAINARGTVKATLGSVNVPGRRAPACWSSPATRSSPTTTAWSSCRGTRSRRSPRRPPRARQKEEATRARLAAGELGLDIYGMRDTLAKAGLRYVDGQGD